MDEENKRKVVENRGLLKGKPESLEGFPKFFPMSQILISQLSLEKNNLVITGLIEIFQMGE